MKKLFLFLTLISLSFIVKAEDILSLYIDKIYTSAYPQVVIVGYVFDEGQISTLQANNFDILEEGISGANITCNVLQHDSDGYAFMLSYTSKLNTQSKYITKIRIEYNGFHNGSEGQRFTFDISNSTFSQTANDNGKDLSAILKNYDIDKLVVEQLANRSETQSTTSANTNDLDFDSQVLGQTFFHSNVLYNNEDCSFIARSCYDPYGKLEFTPEKTVYQYYEEDLRELKIDNIQKGKKETKLLLTNVYEDSSEPWFLSFDENGVLNIRVVSNSGIYTESYVNEKSIDKFILLYPYNKDCYDEFDNCYGDEVTFYYELSPSERSAVNYVANYKGCPLRISADIQSKMIRYLLKDEPVRVIKEVSDNWVQIEDVFGKIGYLHSNDLKTL